MTKTKTCKACKCKFTPIRQFQVVCNSYLCTIAYVNLSRTRQNKKEVSEYQKEKKERLTALKTKSDWLKETQIVFNFWIRKRDEHLGCCSCDKTALWQGQWHASHYRSVGACPSLRFDELNVNKSCSVCNNFLSSNAIEYRIRLLKKIGLDKVEYLEGEHTPKKYTIEDIKLIKNDYKNRLK